MRKLLLMLGVFGFILFGCETDEDVLPPYIPFFMLSEVEGKYYITGLGVPDDKVKEFEQVVNRNITLITGYYMNGNPSEKELNALVVKSLPVYIVFDSEREVFRTDKIYELDKFLLEKTKLDEPTETRNQR